MAFPRLSDVLGQERAITRLRSALSSGRVHHAWIFHGPSGVGKRLAADGFAAALLDPTTARPEGGDVGPDPAGETQRLLAAGMHPDLHIVSKELAAYSRDETVRRSKQRVLPVEVIREFLLEPAALASGVARASIARKVFIVEEAHLMAASAANAALKTLEEPPEGVVVILLTESESDLLPTIRSRCQRVPFGTLSDDAMARWLERSDAGAGAPRDEREWLLAFAGGSPGRFLSAASGGLYRWRQAIAPMLAEAERGRFSAELGGACAKLIDEWAKAEVDGKENASKDAANKAGADRMFTLLSAWARGRIREAAARGDAEGASRAAAAAESIALAESQVDANANLGVALDHLAMTLARR